jgi:hypothetical protein
MATSTSTPRRAPAAASATKRGSFGATASTSTPSPQQTLLAACGSPRKSGGAGRSPVWKGLHQGDHHLVLEGERLGSLYRARTRGEVAVAWDTYDKGDYDICFNAALTMSEPVPVAASTRFDQDGSRCAEARAGRSDAVRVPAQVRRHPSLEGGTTIRRSNR